MDLDEADGVSWPVVIAGASFAGLAVAAEVDQEVGLLDRFPVGTHQASACATFVSTLEDFGLRRAILRTFESVVLHVPRPLRIELVDPLCTFDFGILCSQLFAQSHSAFFQTDVRGIVGHTVETGTGAFASDLLVDATGWSARLASSLDPNLVDPRRLTFGIETQVDLEEDTMHFFAAPELIPRGAAWIFPVDRGCRVGVASYEGAHDLRPALDRLLRLMGATPGEIHGGATPWTLRPGTVRDVFLVGDAAGLAPPLTVEGIRLALHYGRYCGNLLNRVLAGSLSVEAAAVRYDNAIRRLHRRYGLLTLLQTGFWKGWDAMIGAIIRPKVAQKAYLRLPLES